MNVRAIIKVFLFLFATGSVVFVMLSFNDVNRYLRLQELKVYFQRSAGDDNSTDHMLLLGKFHLQKKMFEQKVDRYHSDLMELRVSTLFSGDLRKKKPLPEKYKAIVTLTVPLLNGVRHLMGKPPLLLLSEEKQNEYLDIAYYYERNQNYQKAAQLFDKALTGAGLDREKKSGILLHQGFCYAVMGNNAEAKKLFSGILEKYPTERAAPTAAVLLHYIEGFNSEIESILKEKDSADKAEKLFYLIAYRESLQVLKKIENTSSEKERSRIAYFSGRCLESLGDKDGAVQIYQKIILDDTKSEYARLANRRIYVSAAASVQNEKLKDLALKNNAILKDDSLEDLVAEEARIEKLSEDSSDPELLKEFREMINRYETATSAKKSDEVADALLKSADEKIAETKEEPTSPRAVAKKSYKIYTKTGNIFVGEIVSETSEKISLKTRVGTVSISKTDILKKERI